MSLANCSPQSVRLPKEQLSWLDERAKGLHVSRSHVLRWLVEAAMASDVEFDAKPGRNKKFTRFIDALA